MLYYYQRNPEEENLLGVDVETLVISIGLAILHALMESFQLNYEAAACATSLGNYFVICFNGKLGWTPFIENMIQIANDKDINKTKGKICFDYDNIVYSNWCLKVQVPFSFSDVALNTLNKTVSEMPYLDNKFTIKLGPSIRDLPINEIHQTVTHCGPKTDL